MFETNADGSCVIHLTEGQVVLRPPTLGEYRELRKGARALAEQSRALIESLAPDDGRDPLEEQEPAIIEWWKTAVDTLGVSGSLPDPDSWPAWMVWGTNAIGDVLAHWRAVPSVPGAR